MKFELPAHSRPVAGTVCGKNTAKKPEHRPEASGTRRGARVALEQPKSFRWVQLGQHAVEQRRRIAACVMQENTAVAHGDVMLQRVGRWHSDGLLVDQLAFSNLETR